VGVVTCNACSNAVTPLALHGSSDYKALDLSMGLLLCRMPRVSVEREQGCGKDDGGLIDIAEK